MLEKRRSGRRLLILVYAFPPANNVASLRGVRMGRAFAKRGWDVHVLKSDFHPSPPELDIDVSGLTIHDYHPSALNRFVATASPRRSAKSLLTSLARRLVFPDYSWLMRNAVDRAVETLGGLSQFDCVISSALPFVLHDVCLARRSKGERFFWVADTRDMWAGSAYRRAHMVPERSLRRIEEKVFGACDLATFTSQSTARIYAERYPVQPEIVLNGTEGSCEPMNSKIPPLRRFVHAGSLYGGHRDLRPLIGALEMLSNGDAEARELVLAGPDSDVAAAKLEATPPVRITDLGHLSRTAAADLQRGADALVLATADTDFDASYTPAKLFEYAFRGKPIVATAREESDVAKLVRSHNLGVASLDPSTIASFIGEVERGEWGGPTELVELTSEFQFGRLADMIEERVCDQRRNGDEIGEDD